MKHILFILVGVFLSPLLYGQLSSTFEMRYFTKDSRANGETDFKGETAWMDTEQRVVSLNTYADYASRYFNNPQLDQVIVTDEEIDALLNQLKPQPLPNVRQVLSLDGWRAYGYRTGQNEEKKTALTGWAGHPGAEVADGALNLQDASVQKKIDTLSWRFKLETKLQVSAGASLSLRLSGAGKAAIDLAFANGKLVGQSGGKPIRTETPGTGWMDLTIEGDFTERRFNLYLDNQLVYDFVGMNDATVGAVDQLLLESRGLVKIDDLFLFNHLPTDSARQPFRSEVVIDEDFSEKPAPLGWQEAAFDDSFWNTVDLPAVHGGMREAGEDLYLRKKVKLGRFERATLELETLDPGGEIWINGEVVTVVDNRLPQAVDISNYLRPEQENLIAIRVKAYTSRIPMLHAPDDRHIGWFLGRSKLVLSSLSMISLAEAHTKEIGGQSAVQQHKIQVHHPRSDQFGGSLEINYYPWFPEEGARVASHTEKITIRPRIQNEYAIEVPIISPSLWQAGAPHLYRVEVILRDENGKALDDQVFTTGIRTLAQENGNLLVNGRPEMLNGVQIMGFRTPVENLAKYNRSAPWQTIAEELIMVQKMDANLLRIHVHAEKDTVDGINDPRYAEFADQLGIYLIWSTAGFIREGEAWNVDFEGYPKYMAQVYNHPSIVLWEASNHPNRFKQHDIADTHDYIKRVYHALYEKDQSRLISPTSFWQHTHYANHQGTRDHRGNAMEAVPEFHAHQMTRGSQDAYSGYGAEWTKIRKMPNEWAASTLAANDMAYFNFEHEESAAQPNWDLSKGKPWYKVQSYEWEYEEGSIGRKLQANEWRASQAWQAFSAWESMKKQMLIGYDGFSWCSLRGGANMGTYQKPLIDNLRHPKLAYYVNKMVFQRTWAASENVDVVYGPDDRITPVIHHIGDAKDVRLEIKLKNEKGKTVATRLFDQISLSGGRQVYRLDPFQFRNVAEGHYFIEYVLYPL